MNPWGPLLVLAAASGVLAGARWDLGKAVIVGAAVPWFGLLAWLLYSEYVLPYRGGGASMWPIAQMFAGSIAAIAGGGVAALTVLVRRGR